jgi:hypothetical protein
MPGYNPTRRNRNVGTPKSGHGQNNRMTIPEVAHGEHTYWERIDDAYEVTRIIADQTVKFYVQPTRTDCVHSCTVDDVARLLLHVPCRDWDGVGAVLLRQPRRKEQTLASVWGRLAYSADLAKGGRVVYSGAAIVLEAVNPDAPIKFGRSLPIDAMAELDRLRSDGHEIKSDRHNTIQPSLESCRTTQLYRTFLHELGHWVDFLEKVERPAASGSADPDDRYVRLFDKFHARPIKEKEQFAHSYADRLRKKLTATGAIPFDRQLEPERLIQDKLRIEDFVIS